MKLGKLSCVIDEYTSANTISVMLNDYVLGLYDKGDFYIKITSELEKVEVLEHFLACNDGIYIIKLDIDSFKAVFRI